MCCHCAPLGLLALARFAHIIGPYHAAALRAIVAYIARIAAKNCRYCDIAEKRYNRTFHARRVVAPALPL